MDMNDTCLSHSFNLQEHGLMSLYMQSHINTEWEKTMHSGHDAFYIIRKRALLLDLWNMEISFEMTSAVSPLNKEEENSKKYREYAQREFLKEVSEEKNSWDLDMDSLPKKDTAWNWDCPTTIQ